MTEQIDHERRHKNPRIEDARMSFGDHLEELRRRAEGEQARSIFGFIGNGA